MKWRVVKIRPDRFDLQGGFGDDWHFLSTHPSLHLAEAALNNAFEERQANLTPEVMLEKELEE